MTFSPLRADNYLCAYPPILMPGALKSERILITGASGFIGTNLLEFYRVWHAGAVANLDSAPPRNPQHRELWQAVDIRDAQALRAAVTAFQPTAVFHLAARTDLLGNTVADYAANSDGVENIIAAIRALPSRPRLIVASSRLVCDISYHPKTDTDYAPPNAYGESKVLSETITRRACGNSIPWILVRPTSIWGPWFDIPYRDFFEAVWRGLYLHPGNARVYKSFGFVGNTVHQFDHLMFGAFPKAQGRTYYLADAPMEVLPWASSIAAAFGVRPPLRAPYLLLVIAGKVGDALKAVGWNNPPLTSFRLANLTTDMVIDYMQAQDLTGPGPYSMDEAVAVTVEWMVRGPTSQQKTE